ncbi:hypothetical protein [Streptomyces sp. A1499]|uniref:hypothetical protein n=1 Tax=Streptomyces sp. A1499 TaxID=2563104 RepID=UPI00109E96BA|nr:hypothetical protein [Streptomyces sp. A1499]THC44801.1 hypothetical protein E7X58_32975 [Streptomyces sp. A1499]
MAVGIVEQRYAGAPPPAASQPSRKAARRGVALPRRRSRRLEAAAVEHQVFAALEASEDAPAAEPTGSPTRVSSMVAKIPPPQRRSASHHHQQ